MNSKTSQLNALAHGSTKDLSDVQIILFEVNSYNRNRSSFVQGVKDQIRTGTHPPFLRNMIVLDLAPLYTNDHYYVLDDHLNRHGHAMVARELVKAIARRFKKRPS